MCTRWCLPVVTCITLLQPKAFSCVATCTRALGALSSNLHVGACVPALLLRSRMRTISPLLAMSLCFLGLFLFCFCLAAVFCFSFACLCIFLQDRPTEPPRMIILREAGNEALLHCAWREVRGYLHCARRGKAGNDAIYIAHYI